MGWRMRTADDMADLHREAAADAAVQSLDMAQALLVPLLTPPQ